MTGESKYLNSYGYFYQETNTSGGKYLLLPDGHEHSDRIKIAEDNKIAWDICLFFYNDNISEPYLTNNDNDKDNAIGIDIKGEIKYCVNIETYEKTKVGSIEKP